MGVKMGVKLFASSARTVSTAGHQHTTAQTINSSARHAWVGGGIITGHCCAVPVERTHSRSCSCTLHTGCASFGTAFDNRRLPRQIITDTLHT